MRDNSYGGSSGYDSISSNGGARPKLQKVFFFNMTQHIMVFNAALSDISDMLWRSVFLVEETGENHPPAASH